MLGMATLGKWQKRLQAALQQKQLEQFQARRAAREAKGLWKDRKVAVYHSLGTLAEGKARPTSAGKDKPLNTVNFKTGQQLVFSDGSFRSPGRRRLRRQDGTVLSGRQLRHLQKTARRTMKAAAERDAAAQSVQQPSA